MGKTVPATKLTERKGLDRNTDVFHEMCPVWREMMKNIFGLTEESRRLGVHEANTGH
jgi:hypothetical protein